MANNSQFGNIDASTHQGRLNKLKSLSSKQYLDDGPVALYYCIKTAQDKGFHGIVEFAIRELEKLYNI